MQKIVIAQKFHRYVPTGEVRTVPRIGGGTEEVAVERREDFPVGKTLTVPGQVSADDAASWIEKGLARDASAPPSETAAA